MPLDSFEAERQEEPGRALPNRTFQFPYTVVLRVDEEGDVIATIAELQGCTAHGKDVTEALDYLQDVMRVWLELARESGNPIPEPVTQESFSDERSKLRVERRALKANIERLERKIAGARGCQECDGNSTIETAPAGAGHSDDLAEYQRCPACVNGVVFPVEEK